MKILILAAGYGTRLNEITKNKPKAFLEVKNRALIDHIIDRLKVLNDINEIIVVSNEKFHTDFESWAAQINFNNIPIKVLNDGSLTPDDRLGSIGDIDFVLKNQSIEEDLLVVGSDNLFNFDLEGFVNFAQSHPEAATIGLYDIGRKEDATEYGVVALEPTGKIASFEEKPDKPKSSLISMCFYYLPKATLNQVQAYLQAVGKADKAGDYIKWLSEEKEVYGFQFEGAWYDIGSIESYQEAQEQF